MATITIPCIGDTYINEASKGTNYGSSSQILVDGDSERTRRCDAFWFFDLSSLKYKKIKNASLSIYVASKNIGTNYRGFIHAFRVYSNAENAITWNNRKDHMNESLWNHTYYTSRIKNASTPGWVSLPLESKFGERVDNLYMLRAYNMHDDNSFSVSSRESGNATYLAIEYEDVPPNVPTNISPINTSFDSSKAINFAWVHSSAYGGAQSKFNLEWRKTGTATWNVITRTTSVNSYTMPASTFPDGTIEWRVRTYDQNNIAGGYATGTITTLDHTKVPPNAPTNINPTNANVDSSAVINFTWEHSPVYGGGQVKFDFEWRKVGISAWTTISQTSATGAYSMPANTLPEGTIEWRVRTYDSNNVAGAYSTGILYATNLAIIPPNPPKNLSPNGIYLDSKKAIKFEWEHSPTYGGTQLKFELNWRKLGTTTWTTIAQTTSNNYYDMPGDTFPSGNIEWRVRTYDQNSNVSNYSTSKFYSIGAPPKPTIISIKNSCLTEIKWNSEEQDIYELIISKEDTEIYHTGEKAGYNTFSHKPNIFLENGTYTVKIRTRNSYGLYSDYTEVIFSISTNKPSRPILYLSQSDSGVLINAEFATDKAVLFRSDGEEVAMIAILDSNTYHDHEIQSGVDYEYFVRAYDAGYEDSEKKTVAVKYGGVKIHSIESDIPVVINESLDDFYIPRNYSKSNNNNFVNYIGREYPVREYAGHKEMISSISGYISKEQKELICKIYDNNEIICYLSADEKFYCAITKLNYSNAFLEQGFKFSMELTRIDHDEGVIVNA